MGDILGEIIHDELTQGRGHQHPTAPGAVLGQAEAQGLTDLQKRRPLPPGDFPEVGAGQGRAGPGSGAGAGPWRDRADYLVLRIAQLLRDSTFTAALPAHNKPHYYSFPIDLSNRVAVAGAAMAPGVWGTGITYVVPAGCQARIESYGVNVGLDPGGGAYTYNGSLIWRIQVNGQSKYSDLDGWTIQRGSIVLPRATVMNIKEDDVLTFQYRRAVAWAGGAQNVDFCIVGYTWRYRQNLDGGRASIVYTG